MSQIRHINNFTATLTAEKANGVYDCTVGSAAIDELALKAGIPVSSMTSAVHCIVPVTILDSANNVIAYCDITAWDDANDYFTISNVVEIFDFGGDFTLPIGTKFNCRLRADLTDNPIRGLTSEDVAANTTVSAPYYGVHVVRLGSAVTAITINVPNISGHNGSTNPDAIYGGMVESKLVIHNNTAGTAPTFSYYTTNTMLWEGSTEPAFAGANNGERIVIEFLGIQDGEMLARWTSYLP